MALEGKTMTISKAELRGIVAAWKRDTRKPSITVEWSDNIASLISALVEERTTVVTLYRQFQEKGKLPPKMRPTAEDCTQALRELDLEGVLSPQTHAPNCALTLNARHDCSCGR